MKIINCIECAAPWGAILDRPGDTEDGARTAILTEMTTDWAAQWDLDRDLAWSPAPPPMPDPTFRTEQVVHVTTADAQWLSNNGLAEMFVEPCWQPVADTDLPAWFVRARPVRTAVIVDRCCDRRTQPDREYARIVADALGRLLTAA